MNRIVIHVGLPKTGSTTLQGGVFPHIKGILYLGPKGVPGTEPRRATVGGIVIRALKHHTRDVLAGPPIARLASARDWIARRPGTVLLSEEGLASNTSANIHGYDRIPIMPAAIRALFPDATAVLVLREPHDWLASQMLQRMHKNALRAVESSGDRPARPREFVDWDFRRADDGQPASIFATGARFDRMLAAYRAGFAPERFHLFAFERLFGPDEGWRSAFARVLGVPVAVPAPVRQNASSDDRRREIARRFYDDADRIERFVEQWRGAKAMLRAHPRVQAHLAAHCLPAWREAMAVAP